MTLRDTHTKLCHFNNGVCCGYDSKTKSRPASIITSLNLFPHKNNTLVYALYRIGKLRTLLDKTCIEKLVHAFISSRLDYCNSILYACIWLSVLRNS